MASASLGAFGESWAAGYLSRQGYVVLARNVRLGRDEIDIVARDGSETVFVEVKCRRGDSFGLPEEAITPARYRRLARAIESYLAASDETIYSYRVDVIALTVDRSGRVSRCNLLRAVAPPGG